MIRCYPTKRSAFTLVEVLTVIAIIAVLSAILIPTIGEVLTRASFTKDASNLRQLGVANQLYMLDNNGLLVQPFTKDASGAIISDSWTWNLMPYVADYKDLSVEEKWAIELSPDSIFNSPAREEDSTERGRTYGLNFQIYNIDGPGKGKLSNIPDPARIVHIGPTEFADNQWMKTSDGKGPGPAMAFRYGDTTNFLFADGHVDAHTAEEMVLEPEDGSKSKFRWW